VLGAVPGAVVDQLLAAKRAERPGQGARQRRHARIERDPLLAIDVGAERGALGVARPAEVERGAQKAGAVAHAVDVRPHADLRPEQRAQALERVAALELGAQRQLAELEGQPERGRELVRSHDIGPVRHPHLPGCSRSPRAA
jgi:hypothetical protein